MKIRNLVLITMALMAVSCQEEFSEQDWSEPSGADMTFKVTAPAVDGSNIIWPKGSRIGLFCEQTGDENTPVELSAGSAMTDEADFFTELEWQEGMHRILVYYPYKNENEGTVLSGNLSSVFQLNGESPEKLSPKNLYYAAVETERLAAGQFIPVTLKSIFDLGEVHFAGSKYAGYDFEQLTFVTKSGKVLAGDYHFDLNSGKLTFAEDAKSEMSIVASNVQISSEGNVLYFLSNEIEGLNEACDVSVKVSKGKNSLLLTGEVVLTRNTAINLDELASESLSDDTFDLSDPEGNGQVETANCYIVGTPGKQYKFPATVMGNGYTTPADDSYTVSDGVEGGSPGITPRTLVPASAKLLWQTERSLIQNVQLKNGYVYFTLNGEEGGTLTEGNAVIAVYDDPDAMGTILWSWHIWVTAEDLDAKVQTWKINSALEQYSNYVNPQLMDRNLGALSERGFEANGKNLDMGLIYQWGRKDPFIGADDSKWASIAQRVTYDAEDNVIAGYAPAGDTYSSEAKWTYVNKKHFTKENLAESPMAFYWTGTTKNNQFWLDEICHDLWGCPGYPDDSNNIGHKTIYDPCPRGYRVMNAYAMSGVKESPVGGDLIKTGEGEPNILNASSFSQDKAALQVKYDGEHIAYIPLNGMTLFEKVQFPLYRTGTYGYLWTTKMTDRWNCRAYRVHIDVNHFHVGGPKGNGYTSYGHGVRCEKIKD